MPSEERPLKRILFVDDEPFVLQGLQRMLRPMRTEWEMVFAESGAQALEIMGRTSFDVVVSDMRMPGMSGAELLAEVLKRSPQTVRLILSGHADRNLILKCVGSTHQFLSKPCQPEELKAAIARASNLTQSLQDENLRHLVSRMERVPSMPNLYIQIVEKLEDPEVGLDEIGSIITKDMGMSAKILKLANSSFFGARREISNLTEALSYLGSETIKALVLSVHAFSQFEGNGTGGLSMNALWDHSQITAGLAKAIACMESTDQKIIQEAFVAGLLHDIGKVVLAANFPKEYEHVLERGKQGSLFLLTMEENTFGANHAEVGGYLLGLWGLPVPVVEAIALHHNPTRCTHQGFSALTAVHAANALANSELSPGSVFISEILDPRYLTELGLESRVERWRANTGSHIGE